MLAAVFLVANLKSIDALLLTDIEWETLLFAH
jgi:hypothetical protein